MPFVKVLYKREQRAEANFIFDSLCQLEISYIFFVYQHLFKMTYTPRQALELILANLVTKYHTWDLGGRIMMC